MEFTYLNVMDANRYKDGISFRHRFAYENGIPSSDIDICMDDDPCSVLEMMVSLAFICEERIMEAMDEGKRPYIWFWIMIDNLGLSDMSDDNYEDGYVETVINIFLNREYEPNGKGGLFYIEKPRRDLRLVDIWYQMMWYLNEHYDFSV
jgi:hypothetical protein